MPERMRLYIATHQLAPDELVRVHAPDADGNVDWDTPMSGGRARAHGQRAQVVSGHDRQFPGGPAGHGTPPIVVETPELIHGLYEFGVEIYDRQTGAAATGTRETVTVFANAAPHTVAGLRPLGPDDDGRETFTIDTTGVF